MLQSYVVNRESEFSVALLCAVFCEAFSLPPQCPSFTLSAEKGTYILRLGNSSVHTSVCGVLELEEDRVTLKAKQCCGIPDFADWKPKNIKTDEIPTDVFRLQIKADTIPQHQVVYDIVEEIDPFVDALSDEQLTYATVGYFNPKAGNR